MKKLGSILASAAFWWLALCGCEERHAAECKLECSDRGHCTRRDGKCVASESDDCKRSVACKKFGRCALLGDACQATDAICKTFDGCSAEGFCGVRAGSCAATDKAHCQPTRGCKEDGRCTPAEGLCLPQADDCRASQACTKYGQCSSDGRHCFIGSSADCELGEVCKLQGFCTFRDGRCELTSDADCQKTQGCQRQGVCTYIADNHRSGTGKQPGCIINGSDDCKNSLTCKEKGNCRFRSGVCAK